jgi:prepilin-type N-terminal cleavage/methylation domain-containing protein
VKHTNAEYRGQQGFTLIELVVSMGVFIIILMIAGQSFNNIVTQASKFSKSEESNIEGVIGLEVMRHDLEQMGFGLPWLFKTPTITYDESTLADPSTNDTDSSHNGVPPRAFVGLNGFANYSSDFIAVKGASVGSTKASQRWTYIPFHNYSANPRESRPVSWPSNNLQASSPADRVIVIRSNFNDPTDDHLLMDSGGVFFSNYYTNGNFADDFLPTTDQQTHMVYGIVNSSNNQPRMPFNRADFFIKVPDATTGSALPQFCAPRTGVLYKATVNHNNNSGTSGGGYTYIPLLDCVADMQVVLGWDTSDGGLANNVNAYSSLPNKADSTVSATPASAVANIQTWLTDPKGIREHLKMIKVYILAQEGKRDPGYTYPNPAIVVGDAGLGETFMTRSYALSADQRQYRWKLYRIVARPKNLLNNQR